jgi:putative transposase
LTSATSTVELPRAFAWRIAPELNASKRSRLDAMHREWQRTLATAFDWFWQPFLRGGLLPHNPPRSGPKSTFPQTQLVTSQKDLMAVALQGQAKGWAKNLQRRIARTLMRSATLAQNEGLRRELLWVNSMHAWLLPYRLQCDLLAAAPAKKDKLLVLSAYASRIMRKLVRRYIELRRLPDPMQLPLQVNQLSSVMADASNTTAPWAGRWLRVSTLERGQKLSLPVMNNPYARRKGGREATTFSLFKRAGEWFVVSTRYIAPQHWAEYRTDVLAIDLGLKNLLATSEGDLYGVGFLDKLKRYDKQLLKLQRGLQAAGIRRLSEAKRYRALVRRLQGFLKTTIQTALKRVLDVRRPKSVVIEDLLFAGQPGELSRRMNRLLRRFGQRYFTQTLEERQAELGFTLERVDPAYTSQSCSSCGFVHRNNRQGNNFKCLSCGRHAHADVNAAKNQRERFSKAAAGKDTGAYVTVATRWARALDNWCGNLARAIGQATPGSPRQYRAAGGARAGLTALLESKSSAIRLSLEMKEQLQRCLLASSTSSLLKGLSEAHFANLGLRDSTR